MKYFYSFIPLILLSVVLSAQQTAGTDVVVKMNGDELKGKVLEITDADIKFSYSGESLVYTFKKTDIFKINYASGRSELFNKTSTSDPKADPNTASAKTGPQKSTEDHHNRVAILPFAFVRDGQHTADALSEKVQAECFSYLTKHAGTYKIVEPRTTNAQLIKAGINKDNIKGYSMNDICDILGVEYVVDGLVSLNKSAETVNYSNNGTTTTKSNDKSSNKEKSTSSYSSGTATQEYETSLNLAIYNDKGSSVYNQQRKSILSTQDAYKNTLEYLLKRTPLYSK